MADFDLDHIDHHLREDVRALGNLLGETIAGDNGADALGAIETVRALAKEARTVLANNAAKDSATVWTDLANFLGEQNDEMLVIIARAFNQFLNLANIAEQAHIARQNLAPLALPSHPDLRRAIESLSINLVLTAHPTEVLRRTMIQKYDAIGEVLSQADSPQRQRVLQRLIAESWHSDEIRKTRPTPQDEAKWGFAVIESSLWEALPAALRELDAELETRNLASLPLAATPIKIDTWMGGDRDGNPNVTALVTEEVLMLGRWMAADLYLRDLDELQASLSMTRCSPAIRQRAGNSSEPYRQVMKHLKEKMQATKDWAESRAASPDGGVRAANGDVQSRVFWQADELFNALVEVYESLCECGMRDIAQGPLLDSIRRAATFGSTLTRLDIRQSSDRHADVLDELTRYLNGESDNSKSGYNSWSEARRCEFLLHELASKRPLFPATWPASPEVQEVLATTQLIARLNAAGVAQYVISMAGVPSDVLAVILLLRDAGLERNLPIVPLFETLDDLQRAPDTLDALLSIPWYADYCKGEVQVMIGYSDSAKDAGQFAAAWAQYLAQEKLVDVARKYGIALTLFHGRGGAVGRGGGPAQAAVRSQPPGSINGRLRVTEQGEMIRWKLGTPQLAQETFAGYISATLESSLNPPRVPSAGEREAMEQMSQRSLAAYRATVRTDPDFVSLFRALTPERELGILALGSRPARRAATDDVSSLRAIPWVFAWTQIRLMLPAWLGTEAALEDSVDALQQLRTMLDWPFFRMQVDMLEMVLAKCEPTLTAEYAGQLVSGAAVDQVQALALRLERLRNTLLRLREEPELLAGDPALAASLAVRNTYLDPLHLLQAELLARYRADEQPDSEVARALRVTMAGISSGLRNTG